MKTKSITLFALLSMILFWGCEGNTDYHFYVENLSSEQVEVLVAGPGITPDFVNVFSGETAQVAMTAMLGGSQTAGVPTTHIDEMIITTLTDTCTKDFTLAENWNIVSEQVKKRPSNWRHDFTFTITNGDF